MKTYYRLFKIVALSIGTLIMILGAFAFKILITWIISMMLNNEPLDALFLDNLLFLIFSIYFYVVVAGIIGTSMILAHKNLKKIRQLLGILFMMPLCWLVTIVLRGFLLRGNAVFSNLNFDFGIFLCSLIAFFVLGAILIIDSNKKTISE